jgi:hypothetical protein
VLRLGQKKIGSSARIGDEPGKTSKTPYIFLNKHTIIEWYF